METLKILDEIGVNVDDQTQKVIDILEQKKAVSENKLATALEVKVNVVRKSLYKLNSLGFAYYFRKKDKRKKWWYLYYWSLDKKRLREAYIRHKQAMLDQKMVEMADEQTFSFRCRKKCRKFAYSAALEAEFKCPECGSVLVEAQNGKRIKSLLAEIEELQNELNGQLE